MFWEEEVIAQWVAKTTPPPVATKPPEPLVAATIGQRAYELREEGMFWEGIREKTGRKSVRDVAKKHANSNGLPWPLPRPSREGRAYTRWSEEEYEIIRQALADGRGVRSVEHLFPNRTPSNIHNAFNTVRRRLRGTCSCGAELIGELAKCDKCRAKYRRVRDAALAKGLCGQCCKRPADHSLTKCRRCYDIWKRNHTPERDATSNTGRHHGLVRWLLTTQPQHVSALFNWDLSDWTFVDLFGGSGAFSLYAANRDWKRVVFNDIHPMLVNLARLVQSPHHAPYHERLAELAKLSPEELLRMYEQKMAEGETDAALFQLVTLSVTDLEMRPGHRKIEQVRTPSANYRRNLARHRTLLQDHTVSHRDFADAIAHFDSPKTFFFCDPPWPRSERYEFSLTQERHRELAAMLQNVQGQFLLTTGSTRPSLDAYHLLPHLAWLKVPTGRVLCASSLPLDTMPRTVPLDSTRFGF